jgi:hypothetical protein
MSTRRASEAPTERAAANESTPTRRLPQPGQRNQRRRPAIGDDPGHTDRSTDEQFEGLRHLRSGKLPARVAPADLVETTQTDPPHEDSKQPPVRREWVGAAAGNPAPRTGRGRPSRRTDPGKHRRVCDAVRVRRERAFLPPEATRLPVHLTPRGPSFACDESGDPTTTWPARIRYTHRPERTCRRPTRWPARADRRVGQPRRDRVKHQAQPAPSTIMRGSLSAMSDSG